VIAKNGDGPYVSRRTRDWLKFKCRREQELVIGGYTDPKGQRIGFGALLVGYYSGGKLVYAGKVGTGFDHDILQRLGRQLAALEVPAAGHYGAGTVMVWDRGGYRTKGGIAPAEQLARGKIDVDLQGRKLCGGFTLIRTRPRLADREWWLLVKHRDEHAEPSWNVENPELDYSVLTGRTLKEIQEAGC
jgi:ATP-dependent DNA ligase